MIARRLALVAGALLVVLTTTTVLFLIDRAHSDTGAAAGPTDEELERIDAARVTVLLKRVDTTSSTAVADILIEPVGTLADQRGRFARATSIELSTYRTDPITAPVGGIPSVEERRIAVTGTAIDYPFDRYRIAVTATATSTDDGRTIPVALVVGDSADSFSITPEAQNSDGGVLEIDLIAKRTVPAIVFAGFVMLLMYGVAAAAAAAAYYVLQLHRGLLFPACSMLAAMLFALPPLRHQVPGDPPPPMGSFIDFISFFPAEAVVATSLISAVLGGFVLERRGRTAESG
ncbi:Uncharacterised protein (plasmid) [Tsukamurella tyrosinosolvens]|uniref:DUF4436 domain-containing protein n=1 Tax=Tsukamurella tyrosinosolvens TaxID=57704 RepID=A0A1H4N713_TSUTY|nr:DUF4436 family protein [Tsukamurella tyrosinosolvens]SEB91023.1 protein of unknown function [Tsukamurella tyrosinosolvens]VEI00399.1 Uncharacterised protein [Tsukamurella tyrosinosolvens]